MKEFKTIGERLAYEREPDIFENECVYCEEVELMYGTYEELYRLELESGDEEF